MSLSSRHSPISCAAVLLLTLVTAGCGGGGGGSTDSGGPGDPMVKPPVNLTWNPDIDVLFPPPEGLYFPATIPVRGTLSPYEGSSTVTVDAGAGAVQATVDDTGEWVANDLPLGDTASAMISVKAVNAEGAVWEESVSELLRKQPVFAPQLMVTDRANQRVFLEGFEGDLWVYDLELETLSSISPPDQELIRAQSLVYFPAAEEVVRIAGIQGGGCRYAATNIDTGVTREFLPPQTGEGGCNAKQMSLSISPDGQLLYLVDSAQMVITVLTKTPDLNRSIAFDLDDGDGFVIAGNLWITPLKLMFDPISGDPYLFGELGPLFRGSRYSRLYRLDGLTSQSLLPAKAELLIAAQPEDYGRGRVGNPAWMGRDIYYSHDGELFMMSLDTMGASAVSPAGFVPLSIASLADGGSTDALLLLDEVGNLARLQASDERLTVLDTLTPYRANTVRLSPVARDGSTLYAYRRGVRTVSGFDFSSIDWENLYSLNVQELSLSKVYATSSEKDGILEGTAVVNNEHSIVGDRPPYSLLQHSTGKRSDLLFDDDVSGGFTRYSVSPQGKYLLVSSFAGVFEIDLATLTITRRLDFSGDGFQPKSLWAPIRLDGPEADVYVADRGESTIYKVDFAAQALRVVTSSSVGGEPRPPGLSLSRLTVLPDASGALYTGIRASQLWRLDLLSGSWSGMSRDDTLYPANYGFGGPPIFLPATNTLYSGLEYGKFALVDSVTGARVELPLRHVD